MTTMFSPALSEFIKRYGVIQTWFDRFHNELDGMFEELKRRVEPWGFTSKVFRFPNCRHMIQFYRPNWSNDEGEGVHFELFVDHEEMGHRHIEVGLDIDEAFADRRLTRECLTRLLTPYRNALLDEFGLELRGSKYFKFLRTTLPLEALTVDQMESRCRCLLDLATFVDEALFVRGGEKIWRTDFLPGDPRPDLKWNDTDGGQQFQPQHGLMGSPSLKVNGGLSGNYHPLEEKPTNIMTLTRTNEIRNGDEVYFSCVVNTKVGGRLWLHGEGNLELPDGKRDWPGLFADPRWIELTVPGRVGWQHVGVRARVATPGNYDFGRDGVFVHLRTQTDDPEFLFNSIEFGRCRQQQEQQP